MSKVLTSRILAAECGLDHLATFAVLRALPSRKLQGRLLTFLKDDAGEFVLMNREQALDFLLTCPNETAAVKAYQARLFAEVNEVRAASGQPPFGEELFPDS